MIKVPKRPIPQPPNMRHVLQRRRKTDPWLDAMPLYRKVWALNVKTKKITVPELPTKPVPKLTYSPAKFTSTDMASVLAAQKAVVEQELHEKHSEELKKAPGNTYDFAYADEIGTIKGQDNLVNKLITMPVASPSYVQIQFPSVGEGASFRAAKTMTLKEFREKPASTQKSLLSSAKWGDITFVQLEGSPTKKKVAKQLGRIKKK